MRLGSKTSFAIMEQLNTKNQKIQDLFLQKMKKLTETITVKVMLGDSTVIDQTTFDPNLIKGFYTEIIKSLLDWETQDISTTNNEDLRRIFVKMEFIEGNYLLSMHISIQFHVLLYYKPENRVIECQKELSELIEKTKTTETKLSEDGDRFILNKLEEIGYKDIDHQKLFEIFYENEQLSNQIYDKMQGKTNADVQKMLQKKTELFKELDDFLIEMYQMSPTLIDETKLVNGEEGCLCNIDLEYIKNKTKQGLFNPKKIPEKTKLKIIQQLDRITNQMVL